MSDKVDISGTIRIEDQASPTIRAIQKNIAGIGETARRIGANFKRFANMGALGGVAANARNAAGAVRGFGASLARIGGTLAGIAGVAGFGGLAYEMQNYVASTDALAKTSALIGISVEQLQQLRHAAGMSGVSVETLDSSLMGLNRRMGEAAAGKNKDLAELMKRLGISLRDAKGQVRSAADVLPQLANAFNKNTNATVRARMATALFGKGGMEMINMLAAGGEEMKGLMAEMVRLGLITGAQAKEAEALNDAQDQMNKSIRGVSNAIMAQLVPALLPLVKSFTDWVVVNREWIATGVAGAIEDFGAALRDVPWDEVIEGARSMGATMKYLFEQIGGVKAILPTLAAILGGVVLSSIWPVVSALGALSVAILTNPIGAAITAIAVAAYLIYQNWEGIKQFFADLWANATKNFNDAKAMLTAFVAGFVPDAIKEAWNAIPEWWSNLWSRVKKPTIEGPDGPKQAGWDDYVADAQAQWERLKGNAATAAASIAASFASAFAPGKTLGWTDAIASGDFAAAAKGAMDRFKAGFMTSGVIADFKAYFKPDEVIASWRDYDWVGAAKGFVDRFKSGFMTSGLVADLALFKPDEVIASWGAIDFGAVWDRVKASFDTALGWLDAFKAAFVPGALLDAWAAIDFAGIWSTIRAPFDTALGWLDDFAARFVPGGMLGAWQTYVAALSAIWAGPAAAFQRALGWLAEFRAGFVPADIAAAWQAVSATLSAIWDDPRQAFADAMAWADGFVARFVPGGLLGIWEAVAAGLAAVWDDPRQAFADAMTWADDFVARFHPGGILGVWETVTAALSTIWNAPGEAFDAALAKLAEFAARFIPAPIMQAWGAVAGFFADLWGRIVGVFEDAWARIKPVIDAIMAAIAPLVGAVQSVGAAAGAIAGKAKDTVAGGVSYIRELFGGGEAPVAGAPGAPGAPASPIAPLSSAAPISPVQNVAQAAPPVARVDGEVQTNIKIDLAPGLLASATTKDSGRVNSNVDVGQSMVPA